MNRRAILWWLLGACTAAPAWSEETIPYRAPGQVPSGYPADYAKTIAAAEEEGALVVYSNTDLAVARPLVEDFQSLYPRIELDYQDLNATQLHHRYLAENGLGHDSADALWSSAMDLQMSLVEKGYAQTYASPERAALPSWAVWRDQAFGTTFEPVVIAYNRQAVAAAEVPQAHEDLARLLQAGGDRWRGRVVSYDVERSGLGYLLATQDAAASAAYWDLVRALGVAGTRFQLTTDAMLRALARGNAHIAHNALGAYVMRAARADTAIGYVLPRDYTLVMTRTAFISRRAQHPHAARLWLDYLLSRRGQQLIADRAQLFALRDDVAGATTAAGLMQLAGERLRPIPLDSALARSLDEPARHDFLRRWRMALGKR
ncbi:MAG: ABC transporter substrate-binding protein [Betaproteobacteria bacterium]|nr:ABC transporter substrate-binding protein [Betaproteobacteria bacterium]